uniref:High affinity nitrate transporter 2.5 n=1 Tax=Rhizophora mucronata TaxID=61149 RepID=A0A2P2LJS4_RHIMU
MIINPISDMLVCLENLEPENSNSWVTTAPTVPPHPVIPAITPSDLHANNIHASVSKISASK